MYQRQVSFGEAIRKAIVENYCNFSGRASVSEYWWFALFNFILGMALTCVFGSGTLGTSVSGVVSLALLLPGLGLAVRRLHDIGRSGWWLFLCLIPLVGAVILIVWFCKASQPEINQYGPVPNMVE
ncbi:MAG: DUF805 domain-containing protein [Muribaculaceae bacterium]|nr:DUF805 domain-containing protein [Muribaculaceae bacterium]